MALLSIFLSKPSLHRIASQACSGFIFLLIVQLNLSLSIASPPEEGSSQDEGNSNPSLVYVSDYYSFIGRDDQGYVAFALDSNRGRDGESFQAEHFVVLHDERAGWVDIQGTGAYNHVGGNVLALSDSPTFQFKGRPEFGVTITSQSNELTLTTSSIVKSLYRTDNGGEMWMGSAPATLQWGDRTLKGRVIYEYLMIPEFNRLSRTYWGLWKEYQGFYLSLNGGGDLYLHHQRSEKLTPLIGELDGFLNIEEKVERFQVLQLTPLKFSQALGLYQWPMEWGLRWVTSSGGGEVHLKVSEFHRISNWVLGGFAMGIVQGNVTYQGQTFPVYGVVELIM